jgi:hypothetical protein
MAIPAYAEASLAHEAWFTAAKGGHRSKPAFPQAQAAYKKYRAALARADKLPSDRALIAGYVDALNAYKDEVDQLAYKLAFNAQTKFHSTVQEEFWCLLFGEQLTRLQLAQSTGTPALYIGSGSALQNLFFAPHSLTDLIGQQQQGEPWFHCRTKDRDFMIARPVTLQLSMNGAEVHRASGKGGGNATYKPISAERCLLPIVTIECKQYVDKTMLDNAMAAADHRRLTSPHCLDLITVELHKLTDWNIVSSGLDNLYLLRKQNLATATYDREGAGPTDTVDVTKRKPIQLDVVERVYERTKAHLTAPYWRASVNELLRDGSVHP